MGLDQLKINFRWLKGLKVNLFKQIHKNEEQFELTQNILEDSLSHLNEKARVVRVFNTFPDNFRVFVQEMKVRARMNFFLEHLLEKISDMIHTENKRRMHFIQNHADNIPVQVRRI